MTAAQVRLFACAALVAAMMAMMVWLGASEAAAQFFGVAPSQTPPAPTPQGPGLVSFLVEDTGVSMLIGIEGL